MSRSSVAAGVHFWLAFALAFDARKVFDGPMLATIRTRTRSALASSARATELGEVASTLGRRARTLGTSCDTNGSHSPALRPLMAQLDGLSSEAAMRALSRATVAQPIEETR